MFKDSKIRTLLAILIIISFITCFLNNEIINLILVFLIIINGLFLLKAEKKLKKDKFFNFILLLFSFLTLMSIVVNYNVKNVINMIIDGFKFIVVFILLIDFFEKNHNKQEKIGKYFIYFISFISLFSIFFYIFKINNGYNLFIKTYNISSYEIVRIVGVFSESYILIFFLVASILLITHKLLSSKKDKKTLLYICLVINLIALILTKEYLFIYLFGILFFAYLYCGFMIKLNRKINYIIVFFLLIISTSIYFHPMLKNRISNSFKITNAQIYATGELTFLNPVLGIGPGNFEKEVFNLKEGFTYYTPYKVVSSKLNYKILTNLVERGIISTLLVIVMSFYVFYHALNNYFNNKGLKDLTLFIMISFTMFILYLSNALNYLPIIISIAYLYSVLFNNKKEYKIKLNLSLLITTIILTILLTSLVWLAINFKKIDNKYRPIMEKTRVSNIISVDAKIDNILNNLKKYKKDNSSDYKDYDKHVMLIKEFEKLIKKYIKKENSRKYKSRPFTDLYKYLSSLEMVSNDFTKSDINTIFELTLPAQLYNYSKDEPLLPYYGYSPHKFENISDLNLVYYINLGFHFNPVSASREIKQLLIENKYEEVKRIHKLVVNNFESRIKNDKEYLIAPYLFEFNGYEPKWYSGMAQGVLLEMTALAYQATKDNYYYEIAEKLIPAFSIEYTDGGIVETNPKTNNRFLLEYAYSNKEKELNGSIIGALGLRYWYKASGNKEALNLYREFIQEILYELPNYDYKMDDLPSNASWSKYSLTVFPVQKSYQRLHINLLYLLSQDELIKDLKHYNRVEKYLSLWINGYKYRYPKDDIKELLKVSLN